MVRGALLSVALIACSYRAGTSGLAQDGPGGLARDGAAGRDAEVTRDAGFAIADCPASYTVTIADSRTRYRIIDTLQPFSDSNDSCNADLPGATHLAALDTVKEEVDLQALLSSSARYFVGAVQAPGSTTTTAGWSLITGGSLPPGLWDSADTEPNDNTFGNTTDYGYQQFADLMQLTGPALHDNDPDEYDGAICECDGLAVPSGIADQIAAQIPMN